MTFAARPLFDTALGTLTLTGATIEDIVAAPGARVSLFLRSDGTVDKDEGGDVTQLNPSTDWIIPNAYAASGEFEAKWERVSGISPTQLTPGWTSGVYADLTSDLELGYAPPDVGSESGVIRVTIRRKGDTSDSVSADFDMTAAELP